MISRRALLATAVATPAWAGLPRVLALGGAVTETVFALGAGAALVGSDLTSLYPPAAIRLPKIGYLRALGAEGILSLRPELILASADAGPPAVLEQVAAAGVRVVTLAEAHAEASALARVSQVGAALGREAQADAMLGEMRADLDQVRADVAGVAGRPRVLFLLSAGRGAPMAAGEGTATAAMIRLAGGGRAVQGFHGYRPISAEAALLAAPDVIATTTDTLRGVGGEAGLLALPGMGGARVVDFDSLYLLGFGPRLAHATRDLAAALHPGGAIRPLPRRAWAEPA